MGMIPQLKPNLQGKLEETINKLPLIQDDGEGHAYLLIKDLHPGMERYIQTGKTESAELHVFTEEKERLLIDGWQKDGYEYKYRSHPMEYMGRKITIKYLQVSNPLTGIKISLIPWFMSPGHPYPIFLYAYAALHYINSEQKSMKQSAKAAGAIFGVPGFNKSTVSRSIKSMERLLHACQMDGPLSTAAPAMTCPTESGCITALLRGVHLTGTPEKEPEPKAVYPPSAPWAAIHPKAAMHAFGQIPKELYEMPKPKETTHKKNRDTRKRPPRQRKKEKKPVISNPTGIPARRKEEIRLAYLSLCKGMVLDAAIKYRCLLL